MDATWKKSSSHVCVQLECKVRRQKEKEKDMRCLAPAGFQTHYHTITRDPSLLPVYGHVYVAIWMLRLCASVCFFLSLPIPCASLKFLMILPGASNLKGPKASSASVVLSAPPKTCSRVTQGTRSSDPRPPSLPHMNIQMNSLCIYINFIFSPEDSTSIL